MNNSTPWPSVCWVVCGDGAKVIADHRSLHHPVVDDGTTFDWLGVRNRHEPFAQNFVFSFLHRKPEPPPAVAQRFFYYYPKNYPDFLDIRRNRKRTPSFIARSPYLVWSEWRDSNSRPLAPHASALPGCATFRVAFDCSRKFQPSDQEA